MFTLCIKHGPRQNAAALTKTTYETKRAAILEPHERDAHVLLQQLSTLRNEKESKRKESKKQHDKVGDDGKDCTITVLIVRLQEVQKRKAEEDEVRMQRRKLARKRIFEQQTRTEKRQNNKGAKRSKRNEDD